MTRLAQHKPRPSGERILLTRKAAAHFLGKHVNSIRRYCQPVACDVATHAMLYDFDEAAERFLRRVA